MNAKNDDVDGAKDMFDKITKEIEKQGGKRI